MRNLLLLLLYLSPLIAKGETSTDKDYSLADESFCSQDGSCQKSHLENSLLIRNTILKNFYEKNRIKEKEKISPKHFIVGALILILLSLFIKPH